MAKANFGEMENKFVYAQLKDFMVEKIDYRLKPVGVIRSQITDKEEAPLFYDEDAPAALIELFPEFLNGIFSLIAGDEVIVITWLHLAKRDLMKVHPRGDKNNPLTGVFLTRSPDRPNPIGLHRATIIDIQSTTLLLNAIKAVDGTPVIDIKPVVHSHDD